MGKNSYLGGSTILHSGSSFFSRDRGYKRGYVINAEKDFLLRCVRAQIAGKKYPQSYTEHEKLRSAISKAGSISDWLKQHPDYQSVKVREIKKQRKRAHEQQKKKTLKAVIQKKQTASKEKRTRRELNYLKNLIWAQIVGQPPPQNKPKDFSKKYPTNNKDLLTWATSHEKYDAVYEQMAAKREKQLTKLEENKNRTVKVVLKNTRRGKI